MYDFVKSLNDEHSFKNMCLFLNFVWTLEYAFALKRQIDTIVEYLKKQALPEKISVENVSKEVKNLFE